MLEDYGFDDYFKILAEKRGNGGLSPARVVSRQKDLFTVITDSGERSAKLKGSFTLPSVLKNELPAVGDFVMVREEFGMCVIADILPRKTFLARVGSLLRPNELQPLCANADAAFIVSSINADLNINRLERYASLVIQSGASPVILLTKSDLCEDPAIAEKVKSSFPSAEVIALSAQTGDNVDALKKLLIPRKTYVFLGMSGVGKSTLLNRLFGREIMSTGEIREDDARGRHTTTFRELFLMPDGSLIIDTPGMRELNIGDSNDGVAAVFADIEELAEQCRYRDCSHTKETDCEVKAAVRRGELTQKHLDNYLKLKKKQRTRRKG